MPLGGIIFIIIFIAIFGIFLLFLAKAIGSRMNKPFPIKMAPYECGVPSIEAADTKVSVKFYLTAILFILFDI